MRKILMNFPFLVIVSLLTACASNEVEGPMKPEDFVIDQFRTNTPMPQSKVSGKPSDFFGRKCNSPTNNYPTYSDYFCSY